MFYYFYPEEELSNLFVYLFIFRPIIIYNIPANITINPITTEYTTPLNYIVPKNIMKSPLPKLPYKKLKYLKKN